MSRKRKQRGRKSPATRAHEPQNATNLLHNAIQRLRSGQLEEALRLASLALAKAESPRVAETAREVLAEAHFRAAVTTKPLERRRQLLEEALRYMPDAPRLRFHRGITLWQLGRLPEAISDLDAVVAHEPERKGLAYLHRLAHLVAGEPAQSGALPPDQANTLALLQALVRDGEPSRRPTLPAGPLMGRGPEMWEALAQMHDDAAAAPVDSLKAAAEREGRKSIARFLHYYRGVALLRRGDPKLVEAAWQAAGAAGYDRPWLEHNLKSLRREHVLALAEAGQWLEIVQWSARLQPAGDDRALAETVSVAYDHVGYEAAQAGRWQTAARHWRQANEWASSRARAQNLALAEEALGNWQQAAEAWRGMVRRRPRKPDHPDALSDAQVAAIWSHIAECHEQADELDEAITSLKNAVKYAPDDATLQTKLADALLNTGSTQAGQNALQRTLETDPQNVDALMKLAALYDERWDRDPMPLWRRVLVIDPNHQEAREALAERYVAMSQSEEPRLGFLANMLRRPHKERIKTLEAGLRELPGHPRLLAELGTAYAQDHQPAKARQYLLQAFQAAPDQVSIVGHVLHELLHADAEEEVAGLLPQVRQIPRLLPSFWLGQGQSVLHCELNPAWAVRFFDEALALVSEPWVEESKASILVQVYEMVDDEDDQELAQQIEQRIQTEVPNTGATEYLAAHRLHQQKQDRKQVLRMLRQARRVAQKANDGGMLKIVEVREELLRGGLASLLGALGDLGAGDLPPEFFSDMFDQDR